MSRRTGPGNSKLAPETIARMVGAYRRCVENSGGKRIACGDLQAIADHYGVSRQTVLNHARRHDR
jgi:hypothetical protein